MGQILGRLTNLEVRSYGGAGAATSVSFRGMTAEQTVVSWNGIPLNNVTTGQVDFSMIPAIGFDHISLNFSAPATMYGSGSFGGVVDLSSDFSYNDSKALSIQATNASFHTYSGSGNYAYSNQKTSLKTTLWGTYSKGDFPYFDKFNRKEMNRLNSGNQSLAWMYDQRFRVTKTSELKLGAWLQTKHYEVPAVNGTPPNNATYQNDQSAKFYIGYEQHGANYFIKANTAYLYDFLHYVMKNHPTDTIIAVDSHIYNRRWISDLNYRRFLGEHFIGEVALNYRQLNAKTDNYAGWATEHMMAASGLLKYACKWTTLNVAIREEFHSEYAPKTLFSAGFSLADNVLPVSLNGSFSQKYRVPTFNDKYWVNYGNPDLKFETGYSTEIGIKYRENWDKLQVGISANVFKNFIDNMIYAVPVNGNYIATNITKAQTQGLEGIAYSAITFDNWSTSLKVDAALTESKVLKSGNELFIQEGGPLWYVPKYKINTTWDVRYKPVKLGVIYNYSSGRQAVDTFLPSYQVLSFFTNVNFPIQTHQLACSILINNVLDERYETIRNYPMPGRNYSITINYKF